MRFALLLLLLLVSPAAAQESNDTAPDTPRDNGLLDLPLHYALTGFVLVMLVAVFVYIARKQP
jgi:hypothetical protein